MIANLYQFALIAGCLVGVLVLSLAVGLGWAVWYGGGRRRDDDRKA